MAAVTVAEMRGIEKRAMDSGLTEAELMAGAGEALGNALGRAFPEVGMAVAFIGKGHNAGDALIALRVLEKSFGWRVSVRAAYPVEQWAAMSNGGQGDLLSGVLGALLAGGMQPFDAASLGAWLCGRAAEISQSENGSPVTASDTADDLGLALRDWQKGAR